MGKEKPVAEDKQEKPKLAPIRLVRDTWVGENRIVADGSIIEMPAKDARALIEAGVAERADPLPGE